MRDTPPGHWRFGAGGNGPQSWWAGEPGDVIIQHGKRIGVRYWVVVDVEPLRKWTSVLCRPSSADEVEVLVDEGATAHYCTRSSIVELGPMEGKLLTNQLAKGAP